MYKLNIDSGHGSNTAGKRTPKMEQDIDINKDGKIDIKKGEQYREHYANTMVAEKLYKLLSDNGNFILTKTGWNDLNSKDDIDTALADRQKFIKNNKCDYSVSIHFNAFGDGNSFNSAEGTGIYIHNKNLGDSVLFANTVLKELIKGTKQKNRGVSKEGFAMVNNLSMGTKASILLELAFMTNKREALLMADESFINECAKEIYEGICNYLKIKITYGKSNINTKPEVKDNTKYEIIAGTYSIKENAENMVKTLKQKGIDSYIKTIKK